MPRRQDEEDDEGFGEASRYTAHLDRGWSLLDRGDFAQARSSGLQALKIRPEVPDGAMLMAAISLAEADPESSLEWYERAIEADSEYVDAQLAAAQILLYDIDDPGRALQRAEIARELDEATLADRIDLGVLEVEALTAMGDYASARDRLGNLGELVVLEQLLAPDTAQDDLRQALEQFVGELFDSEDDWEHVVHRAVQLAVRVARLYMDLGAAEAAVPWLDRLLRTFGDDPDIWYLANEAAYIAGDAIKAAQAALQVLQLDAGFPVPEWLPSASELHAKIVEVLLKCHEPQLSALARDPGFMLLVNDAPPVELVLEGIDPRVRALAMAARSIRDLDAPPALTGMAVYRRNLVRVARDRMQLDRELELAVLDELALFFGLDDVRRDRLGLPPADWVPNETRPSRRESEHDDGRRKSSKGRPSVASEPAPKAEPDPATSEPVVAQPVALPQAERPQAKKKPASKPKRLVAKPTPPAIKPAKSKPVAKTRPAAKPSKPVVGARAKDAKLVAKPKPKPKSAKPKQAGKPQPKAAKPKAAAKSASIEHKAKAKRDDKRPRKRDDRDD